MDGGMNISTADDLRVCGMQWMIGWDPPGGCWGEWNAMDDRVVYQYRQGGCWGELNATDDGEANERG